MEKYPIASQVILHDFYVDDLLSGADTVEEAISLREELTTILRAAGLELRKWASNDPRVLGHLDNNKDVISIYGDKDPKTLGLVWDPESDTLRYRVNFQQANRVTKRTILSTVAQIFDPLGLVGPIVIQAKIIMQKLWSLKVDWDETLPQDVHSEWSNIYKNLQDVNHLSVNRCTISTDKDKLEFHGFCDASNIAYGACIYVTSINSIGDRTTRLLCAKSRVAPLKATSTPRLELLGALLLAQLAHKVSVAVNASMENWHFWTDSMVVLAWIKAPSSRWKTFVANRTAEIHELTSESWGHVASGENPADLISRGTSAHELQDSALWWNGPDWTAQGPEQWPNTNDSLQDLPEEKGSSLTFVTTMDHSGDQGKSIEYFKRFSSFQRLIRVTAYIFRFVNNCRKKSALPTLHQYAPHSEEEKLSKNLSVTELQCSTRKLIILIQTENFSKEISDLKRQIGDLGNSSLKQLHPLLEENVLRVGGRLKNAPISNEQKHPIILPQRHPFTLLLIKYEHRRLLHAGPQSVLSSLRELYWILNGINVVKKTLRECIICFKNRPRTASYIMGDLPKVRVTPTRPFFNCGVDYAGPFLTREHSRARVEIKVYVCIFTCLVTRAVHIDIATDQSTEAFLRVFTRFISRRGKCQNIYSDNGTNFRGADRELRDLLTTESFQSDITNFVAREGIRWHFNPPSAPHFGGIWESAVKSAKYHMKRVIGETRLTFEKLYTIVTQIEACMNSRPLSPLSNDPRDLTPLTPAHFLIGDLLTAIPQEDVREIHVNRLNRFQHLQQMLQHFWQRWQREYLPSLQRRTKWNKTGMQRVTPGMMVLIKEDNTAPLQWPLGRIAEIHPGKDGIVRVVSVEVARGVLKRPLTKICVLPFEVDIQPMQDE